MPLPVSGQVGEQIVGPGVTTQPLRQGKLADVIVSELQGRFYEQALSGRLFSGGMTLTAINNATFTTATTGVTATPVLGLWNPANSTINCVLLQAALAAIITAATATGPGGFTWMYALNQSAISTGGSPFNRKTLQSPGGSIAKTFMASPALTGLTGTLAVLEGSELMVGAAANFSEVGTAVGFIPAGAGAVENFDGSLILPPGGLLALMANTTPVAHSASGRLLWAEVPA